MIAGRANRRASGGTDQSAAALVVLKRALEGKIVDPNTPIQGVRPGSAPEPLFIHYYNAWTRAVRERVNVEAWQVMKLLAQHGADLSLPAASEIAANLKKTEMPREWDGAMQLK